MPKTVFVLSTPTPLPPYTHTHTQRIIVNLNFAQRHSEATRRAGHFSAGALAEFKWPGVATVSVCVCVSRLACVRISSNYATRTAAAAPDPDRRTQIEYTMSRIMAVPPRPGEILCTQWRRRRSGDDS